MHTHRAVAAAARALGRRSQGVPSRLKTSKSSGIKPEVHDASTTVAQPLKASSSAAPSSVTVPPAATPAAQAQRPPVTAASRSAKPSSSGGGGAGATLLLLGAAAGGAYYFQDDLGIAEYVAPVEKQARTLLGMGGDETPAAAANSMKKPAPETKPVSKASESKAPASSVPAKVESVAKPEAAKPEIKKAAAEPAKPATSAQSSSAGDKKDAVAQKTATTTQKSSGDVTKPAAVAASADKAVESTAKSAPKQDSKSTADAPSTKAQQPEKPKEAQKEPTSQAQEKAQVESKKEGKTTAAKEEKSDSPAKAAPAAAPTMTLDDIVREAKSRASTFSKDVDSSADTTKWLASILKDDLNTSINLEVEGLDELALRKRVLNLSALLLERNKLEASRMLDFMSQYNEHWQGKFEQFSAAQTAEFEANIDAVKQAFATQLEQENRAVLAAEAARQAESINSQLAQQWAEAMQKESEGRNTAASARVQALEELQAQVQGVATVVGTRQQYETTARKVHAITLSAMALRSALDAGQPLTQHAAAMKVAAGDEPAVMAALDALPASLFGRKGPATRFALDMSFRQSMEEARVAALTPSVGGVAARWVGRVASWLVLSEVPEPKTVGAQVLAAGMASGAGGAAPQNGMAQVASTAKSLVNTVSSSVTGKDADSHVAAAREEAMKALSTTAQSVRTNVGEAVSGAVPSDFSKEASEFLSRARAALPPPGENVDATVAILNKAENAWAAGDLHRTIALLEQLRGLPAAAVKPWLSDATKRALAEQAVAVSNAYASSVAGSLY